MSILITIAALMFVVAASAQSGRPSMVSGPVGLVFPIPDAPLSAQQVEERTRTAPDGTSNTETVVSQIYRDGAGRMRIQWHTSSSLGEGAFIVDLIDPVARSMVTLLVDSKVAVYFVKPHLDSKPFNVGFPAVGLLLPAGKWQTKTQELGTRLIDGIEVEGARTVQTSEDHPPLTAVQERWTSRSLRLTLRVEASGPGWSHTAKLQNLNRHEPDPALFTIPSDYTIEDWK